LARRSKKSAGFGLLRLFGSRRRRVGLIIALLLFLGAQAVVAFVPYGDVPPALQPAYLSVLAYRNKALARSGLPIDWYSSSARVDTAGGDVQVYFAPSNSIDDRLVEFIESATASVDVCVYDLDLPNVVAALVAVHKRGLRVRLITDTDNLYLRELQPLKSAGIPIVDDGREAIMHNKFVIVDGRRLWMGSYNFTDNGTHRNDNNALTIDSPLLAANYTTEFEEMWAGEFGPSSPAATPNPRVRVGDMELRTAFAPDDAVMSMILEAVGRAESRVDLMAFSFTSDPLARALRARAQDGVAVRCLFDARQAENQYSEDEWLAKNGVDVRISANRRGVMHHKVIIIDQRYVITGSFNFSNAADTANDENILLIDSPALAAVYADEYERCWLGTKGY